MDRATVERCLGAYVQAAKDVAAGCDMREERNRREDALDAALDALFADRDRWKVEAVDAYALLAKATGDNEATFAAAVAWLSTNSPARLQELSVYWWDTKRYLKARAAREALAEKEVPDADQP
jgi:hypothetical protein